MRQSFFRDQAEPEPMPNLRQQVHDNDRLASASHSKQDAMLGTISEPGGTHAEFWWIGMLLADSD